MTTQEMTDCEKIFDVYSKSMRINIKTKNEIIETIDEFSFDLTRLQSLEYIINDAIQRHTHLWDFYKKKENLQNTINDLNEILDYINEKIKQLNDPSFIFLK